METAAKVIGGIILLVAIAWYFDYLTADKERKQTALAMYSACMNSQLSDVEGVEDPTLFYRSSNTACGSVTAISFPGFEY